ncbi:MAG: hypothetical protein ABH950_06810 [Candidatus Altiarchaeota archaeon]
MTELEDICLAMGKLQVKQDLHVWATPTAVVKTMKQIDPKTDMSVDKIVHLIQYSGGGKICIASLKSTMDRGFEVKKGLGVVGGRDFKIWDVVLSLRPHTCNFPGGMTCDARTCKCKSLVGLAPEYEALSEEQKRRMGLTGGEIKKPVQANTQPAVRYFKKGGKLFRVTQAPTQKRKIVGSAQPNNRIPRKPGTPGKVVRKVVKRKR